MKSLRRFFLVLLLPCVSALHLSAVAGQLTLAKNGKADAVIVVGSDDPWPNGKPGRALTPTQLAAILAAQLEQMCGAKFSVVPEATLGEVAFKKGRLSFPYAPAGSDVFLLVGEGNVTRKCGLTVEGLGPGGIVVKSLGNAVAMLGRSDHTLTGGEGTGYAVFQFLEALGCRYLWPGELGKVVPRTPTLRVPNLDLRYSPPVVQRSIRFMPEGPRNFDIGLARLGMKKDAYMASYNTAQETKVPVSWGDWMCLGGYLGIVGGHAGYGLKGGWEQYGKTHPEWFALQPNGSRDQGAFGARWRACTSNPGLIDEVAKTILEEAGKNPQQLCFSLAPNDGGSATYCMCAECRKLDPPDAPKVQLRIYDKAGSTEFKTVEYPAMTDRYLHYWNAVAEKITKVRPDLLLTIDAYAEYSTPPVREKLHPNLVVRYVPSDRAGWDGWKKAGAKRIFWRPNTLHSGYREGALWIYAGSIVENACSLADSGMLATDVQGIYDNWAAQGLNSYVMARILWNPSLTYQQILDDYCQKGFGAGAKYVKKYFLRAEELRTPYGVAPKSTPDPKTERSPAVMAELEGYLKAADKAAKGDDDARKRIAFLMAGMEYTAATADLYRRSFVNPAKDSEILRKRWASMKELFERYPMAVNVAVVAGHDDLLIRAFGSPSEAPAPVVKQ